MPILTDRELIESALGGNQGSSGQLVCRYQDRLFRSMLANVGCPDLAEDIVQDAFIRALRHLNNFRFRSNFYTWLYRIALNSRRSYTDKRIRTVQLDLGNDRSPGPRTPSHDSPPVLAERLEDRNQVRSALARLDEKHRTILILREFDDLDYQSIAEIMSLNIGTVRSRLARARAQLKKELVSYQQTGEQRASTMQRNNGPYVGL